MKVHFWKLPPGGTFAQIIYFTGVTNNKEHDVGFYNWYFASAESL